MYGAVHSKVSVGVVIDGMNGINGVAPPFPTPVWVAGAGALVTVPGAGTYSGPAVWEFAPYKKTANVDAMVLIIFGLVDLGLYLTEVNVDDA